MSRIGKVPVQLPAGVKASVKGQEVFVEGSKGKLSFGILPHTSVEVEADKIVV